MSQSSNAEPFYSDMDIFRWGRRRPFIALGALLTIIALLGFGFGSSLHNRSTALTLAVRQFRLHVICTTRMLSHVGG